MPHDLYLVEQEGSLLLEVLATHYTVHESWIMDNNVAIWALLMLHVVFMDSH